MACQREKRPALAAILLCLGLTLQSFTAQAGAVSRSQFTTGIQNREPIDQVSLLGNDSGTIFFFSELHALEGQRITHRWVYGDKTRAEVSFNVGGPRWRVWSSKTLAPDWLGTWVVYVVGEDGEILSENRFEYVDHRPAE